LSGQYDAIRQLQITNNLKLYLYEANKQVYEANKHVLPGRSFSLGTPVSSINKTDSHDITEILLKVALNTIMIIIYVVINLIQENQAMYNFPFCPDRHQLSVNSKSKHQLKIVI
jgi:hypothetical protein